MKNLLLRCHIIYFFCGIRVENYSRNEYNIIMDKKCNCKNGIRKGKNGALFICRDCSKYSMLTELNSLLEKTRAKLNAPINKHEKMALESRLNDLNLTINQVKESFNETQ